jgi:hypothetical protein
VDTSLQRRHPASNLTAARISSIKLSANLTGAGFTNVKIMPDAFIVVATNKSGEAVRQVGRGGHDVPKS